MASKLNLNNIGYFDSEIDAFNTLVKEGRKIEKIARKIWQQYEDSYKPKKYVRTGDSEKALKLKIIPMKLSENEIGIELTWENDLAYHDSWVKNSSKKGHSIILISAGWHSKKLEKHYGRRVYMHTYYEGYGYLTKIAKAYDVVRDKRIGLEFEIANKLKNPRNIKTPIK